MLVVLLGWVLFRASSFEIAGNMVAGMVPIREGVFWCPPLVVFLLGCLGLEHLSHSLQPHALEYVGGF